MLRKLPFWNPTMCGFLFTTYLNFAMAPEPKRHRRMQRPSLLFLTCLAVLVCYLFLQFRHLVRVNVHDAYINALEEELTVPSDTRKSVATQNATIIDSSILGSETNTSMWPNAVTVADGNLQIEFFDRNHRSSQNPGMSACLINLEDTIRMAEWLPYHYTTLPLGSLVIALDPKNSDRGIARTMEIINLWKDKIEITLWPEFFLPQDKIFMEQQSYTRHRQVYFSNQCLAYHKQQNRSWTLLTDNDEYFTFNYVHDDESLDFDHPGASKTRVKQQIKENRKKFMPLRDYLPLQNESTVLEFIQQTDEKRRKKMNRRKKRRLNHDKNATVFEAFFPTCIRLPGIRYGGDRGLQTNEISLQVQSQKEIIEPHFLATLRNIHHEKRQSKFSKVIIDVSRMEAEDLVWSKTNHARTIHNPSRKACGSNGASTSGADYVSSLFRLNHYLGNPESYLERSGDYRKRSMDTYLEKAEKVKPSESNWDTDILEWVELFVRAVGKEQAKKLLAPLVAYQTDAIATPNNETTV